MLNHEEYKQRRDEILNLHWTNGDGTSASFTSAEAAVAIDELVLEREQTLLDEILMVARNQPNGTKEDLLVFIKSKRSIVKESE